MQNPQQQNNPQESELNPQQAEQPRPINPEVVQATKPELELKLEEQAPVEQVPESPVGVNSAPVQSQAADDDQAHQVIQTVSDSPITEDQAKAMEKLDERWVKAADEIIDKYEDKPYEEEEAHEEIQIKYLWQRFKKKLSKSED